MRFCTTPYTVSRPFAYGKFLLITSSPDTAVGLHVANSAFLNPGRSKFMLHSRSKHGCAVEQAFLHTHGNALLYRFSYCALSCCSLLGRMAAVNVNKAVEFLVACRNFDGGFGAVPGVCMPTWPQCYSCIFYLGLLCLTSKLASHHVITCIHG